MKLSKRRDENHTTYNIVLRCNCAGREPLTTSLIFAHLESRVWIAWNLRIVRRIMRQKMQEHEQEARRHFMAPVTSAPDCKINPSWKAYDNTQEELERDLVEHALDVYRGYLAGSPNTYMLDRNFLNAARRLHEFKTKLGDTDA